MTKKLKIKNIAASSEVKAQVPAGATKQAYRFPVLSKVDFTDGPLDFDALSKDPRSIGCRVEIYPGNKLVIIVRSMNGEGINALPVVITGDLKDRLDLDTAGQVDDNMPNLWDYVYVVKDAKLADGRIHLKDFPEVYLETTADNKVKGGRSVTLEIYENRLCLSEESLREERESLARYKDFGLLVKSKAKTKKEGEESYADILRFVTKKLQKLNNYTYPIDSDRY